MRVNKGQEESRMPHFWMGTWVWRTVPFNESGGGAVIKNLQTRVHSLSQEDPLEKEMAIHSSILTWRIPRTEEPGGL